MKTKLPYIITALLICFAGSVAFGQETEQQEQTIYLDAIQLKNIYEKWQTRKYEDMAIGSEMNRILKKYERSTRNFADGSNENPFITADMVPSPQQSAPAEGSNKTNLPSLLTKLNLVDVTAASPKTVSWQAYAIDGLSDFLAERFAQETMNFGMSKAVKLLAKDTLITKCFPGAMAYMQHLNEHRGGYYAADIKLLKELVKSDFKKLPHFIIENEYLIADPYQREMMQIGYNIIDYTERGYSIQGIIRNMAKESSTFQNEDLKKALSFLNILSVGLKNRENATEIWYYPTLRIDAADPSEIVTAKYFYGILFEQAKDHQIFLARDAVTFTQEIQKISAFTKSLNKAYQIAKDNDYRFTSFEDFSRYASQIAAAYQVFFINLQKVSRYGLFRSYDFDKIHTDGYIKLLAAFNEEDYQKVATTLFFMAYGKDDLQKFRNLNFVAELAAMKQPEDMRTVINAYALPLGSSAIKRNSRVNVSLNGYVGATAGWETAYGLQGNQTRMNMGLSAPIGISTTYHGKWTFFVSVLDLGSVVNVRLNNNTDFYSDLKFEHFLMPGGGLFYNIKKTPFSVGVHYGYIPNLRTIEYADGAARIQEHHVSVSRFNFSFLVDIPFFTLFDQ